jgi:hypothetical protein
LNETAKKKLAAIADAESGLNYQPPKVVKAQEQKAKAEKRIAELTAKRENLNLLGSVGCRLMVLGPILIIVVIILIAIFGHK